MSEGRLPSESTDVLGLIADKRVKNLIRVMKPDFERFMADFRIHSNELFQLGHGPLFIELESGEIVGFSSRSITRSITTWLERGDGEKEGVDYLRNKYGPDAQIVDCMSEYSTTQWRAIVGQRVTQIAIIRVTREADIGRPFPNERGILLVGERGDELMVARELIADGPAHMVLMKGDQMRDELKDRVEYLEIQPGKP